MVNILIIEDNLDFAKNLMIYINSSSETCRVSCIATDGIEGLNLIKEIKKIDIIILDLKLPKISGIKIIEKLNLEEKERFKKSIIIISGENYLMQSKTLYNEMVYCTLSKIVGYEEICRKIEELSEQKEQKNLKEKIIKELLFLGYDMSHKGTKYLIDIINKAIIEGKDSIYNLNKEVYPIISNFYNKRVYSVKMNMNRATDNMFFNCQEEVLKKYFYLQDLKKPSTKEVINTIITKVGKSK